MTADPRLDPNFLNRYMVDVEDGPDTRQQFTLPAARAHRARYERPGLLGHLVMGARDVAPPAPWDPDRPRPELAAPQRSTTDKILDYGSMPAKAIAGVFNPPLTPPERPVTGNLPPTERSGYEDIEYANRLGKFGLETGLNMIGAGRLPGASPPGAFGAGGGSPTLPTLRGRAGEQAWRTGTAEERLRTTNHPWGGTTPLRDMPQPIIEGAPNWTYKPIDVERDLRNAELIFMPGDATGAGGRLMGFPGLKFEKPVARMGGNQYAQLMSDKPLPGGSPESQRLWASMQGPMTSIYNVARGVEARGNVPWGVYMTGGKEYMDQSSQMVNTAIEAARATGVSDKANKHLVKVMRSDWNYPADENLLFPKKGLDDPSAVQFWLDNQPMPARAKLVKAMATAESRKLGFPDVGPLRVGNADPRLLTAQPGSAGLMLGRIDTSKGLINPSLHPDYSTAIAGSDLRTFGRQLPVETIAPTMHQQRVAAYGGDPKTSMYLKAPHKYYGAMGTPQKTEPITNQWRDTVQNWQLQNPEQRIGGVVLGAGANDPRSVGLAAGMNAARDQQLGSTVRNARKYPIAPQGEWYGDANYAATGGRMTTMSPDEYLKQARPLTIDETSRENIDLLKQHIESGRTLDPLALYKNMKEDGRHRAYAAKELGIDEVPVLNWRSETLGAGANDPRSVALAAGLNAVRDPNALGGTVRNAAPIRAYHSSPHDFDRFDLSRIGTGEGAQVYGHGLYFAENPKVSGQGGEYWQQFKNRFAYNPAEMEAVNVLENHNFDRAKAIEELRDSKRYDAGYIGGATNSFDRAKREAIVAKNHEALALLESGKIVGPRTYEVNINARPEQLLDWDKPLKQQPETLEKIQEGFPYYPFKPEETGQSVYTGFVGYPYSNPGTTRDQAKRIISERLGEAGIPGIRYLDEGSRDLLRWERDMQQARFDLARVQREHADPYEMDLIKNHLATLEQSKPAATSNYVIFDPGIIEIAKKYGIPGMLGAGVLGETVRRDKYGEPRT